MPTERITEDSDEDFISNFRKWITELYASDSPIEISDPIKSKSLLGSSISFTITNYNCSVKRKLSDFNGIIELLINRYPSISFPDFQLSTLYNEDPENFIKRVRKIIETVSSIPFLLYDNNYTDFLFFTSDYDKVSPVRTTFRVYLIFILA